MKVGKSVAVGFPTFSDMGRCGSPAPVADSAEEVKVSVEIDLATAEGETAVEHYLRHGLVVSTVANEPY